MQRKQIVALVAGASLGMGTGALGAFLAWAAVGAAAHRFLEQFDDQDDQDIELEQPAPSATRRGTQQASSGSTPVMPPASDPSLPNAKEAVTSAQAP